MRMKLACFILRQFMAAGHLSIAVADGPMHHIKARRTGPQVAIRLARRGVLWRLTRICFGLAALIFPAGQSGMWRIIMI